MYYFLVEILGKPRAAAKPWRVRTGSQEVEVIPAKIWDPARMILHFFAYMLSATRAATLAGIHFGHFLFALVRPDLLHLA